MPGSGKGTQAEMLAHDIGYERFSTGNAFRRIALEDTPFGREVKNTIDKGLLTSPEMATKVVLDAAADVVASNKGIIFDGTPRTIEEATAINAHFTDKGYGIPLVIFLEVNKETMIERNSKRRVCLHIDAEFPVTNPEEEQRCVSLGGTVGIRPDDEEHIFATRYNQFMDLTHPVIMLHQEQHPEYFFRIDGMVEPHRVHAAVMDVVSQFDIS